ALQYGPVVGRAARRPCPTSQARTRATAARQLPSGLATWVRKAQRVTTGVETLCRQHAPSSRRAAWTRSAGRTWAKAGPSAWANCARRVSIWRRRRRGVESGIGDLLV